MKYEPKQYRRERYCDSCSLYCKSGNTFKPDNFEFAIEFMKEEIRRADAIRATQMTMHPGAHVGAGPEAGIDKIAEGLNRILSADQNVQIALETMAGKGQKLVVPLKN